MNTAASATAKGNGRPGQVYDYEKETDKHRVAQRLRQIDLGKATLAYHNYTKRVWK